MAKKKVRKEERAYLYFRENNKGSLNIKFGPDKYTKDTSKFYEILIMGILQSVTFLSNMMADFDLEKRKENYDIISNAFQAILFEAFPDIKEEIFKEIELEEVVAEAVEKGEKIEVENEEEFLAKVEETKENLREKMYTPKPLIDVEELEKILIEINEAEVAFEKLLNKVQGNRNYFNKKEKEIFANLLERALHVNDIRYMEIKEKLSSVPTKDERTN